MKAKNKTILAIGLFLLITAVGTVFAQEDEITKITSKIDTLIKWAQLIAYPIGTLIIAVSAGIGTIFKAGDPEAMEQLKTKLRNVAIGLLIVGFAGTLVEIIKSLVA